MEERDPELVKEFLVESNENLEAMNKNITELEKNPENKDILNELYRHTHTLKGSASFLNYNHLQSITHESENILDLLREGEVKLNPCIIETLLESIDKTSDIIQKINDTSSDSGIDISPTIQKLKGLAISSPEVIITKDNMPSEASGIAPVSLKIKDDVAIKSTPQKKSLSPQRSEDKKKPLLSKKREEIIGKKSLKNEPIVDTTIRVNVNLLDKIMNVVGELVLNRNQILQYSNSTESPELSRLSHQLNAITTELQTDIMTTRMQPIGSILSKFERVIRDLARAQKKKISFSISGRETELDKTLLEAIKDPLTHLIRNAVDHGIEAPSKREERGKTGDGKITIKAYHEGGQVTIEISDNGNGIDSSVIISKAISKGLITQEQGERLTDKQAHNLIFLPGFSTAEQVTNISGRGVGMDVVKTNVEKIGGSVIVSSVLGAGSTFKLKIPLTLAIIPALTVKAAGESFAIPQVNLVELVRLEGKEKLSLIEELHDSEFFRLRNELIPIFRLKDELKIFKNSHTASLEKVIEPPLKALNIVILNAEGKNYGLIVDEILDTQEIVVKPLGRILKHLHLFAGGTIMGDGRVALIIDTLGFLNTVTGRSEESAAANSLEMISNDENLDDSSLGKKGSEYLLFKLSDKQIYGLPLEKINRLEEFKISQVEVSGEASLIRYRNAPMPLINIEKSLGFHEKPQLKKTDHSENINVLVIKTGDHLSGLIVSSIRDIATSYEELDTSNIDRESISGTVFINNKTISILNIEYILKGSGLHGLENIVIGEKGQLDVLLVEGNPIYQKVESDVLKQLGHNVYIVDDGVQAIEALKSERNFNLIITDIEMPNMNGFELTKEVKAHKRTSNIPIIAITTKVDPENIEKGRVLGMSKYLAKFDRAELEDAIDDVFATTGS